MRAASYPRVVLAQRCCRLTLATSASAEGVWVMWMGPVNPQPGTRTWEVWSPLHSYEALEPPIISTTSAFPTPWPRLGRRGSEPTVYAQLSTPQCLRDLVRRLE